MLHSNQNTYRHCIQTILILIVLFPLVFLITISCQNNSASSKTKLVVTVVVDQMRYEYLDRYADKFGEGGFKRLISDGYDYRNAHYNFMPTGTGPGHAAIYSGALPSVSGIVSNGWYDRKLKKPVNVVSGNDTYRTVGLPDSITTGRASPEKLLVTTIADELKKSFQFKSKTITVSIKDRSAILSGGHTADGAYWYDGRSGKFISSSYYMENLPKWVEDFNKSGLKDSLNAATWNLTNSIETYSRSRPDNNKYERKLGGRETPVFPYDLKQMNEGRNHYFYIPNTTFGNDLVEHFAEDAIIHEKLGKGENIDFLAVNFSSTDMAGHIFGPYAVEVEDMYIKLDKTIEKFLTFLEHEVGKNNYTLVLTSDHGAVGGPEYLKSKKLPNDSFNPNELAANANEHIKLKFGIDSVIAHHDNMQFYLDKEKMSNHALEQDISLELKNFLEQQQMVHSAYTREELLKYTSSEAGPLKFLKNGYFGKRSGDVLFISNPGWLGFTGRIVTGHGSPFSYDTHVPLLWYGNGIRPGSSVKRVNVTSIAPTLSFITGVMLPSGCYAAPLEELFK